MAAPEDELRQPLNRYAACERPCETSSESKQEQSSYAESNYWEQRFAIDEGSESFDWYVGFGEIEDAFEKHCPPSPGLRTLMVGCGTAPLSSEMYSAGYQCMINVDIVPSVVSHMRAKCLSEQPAKPMEWAAMDATRMAVRSGSVDLAIDKGTLDALLSGPEVAQAAAMLAEVWRTLTPGGLFFLITHSRSRGPLLDDAIHAHHGDCAAWEVVEARWNRLSNQATLINLIRARLGQGETLVDGFRNIALLQDVGEEVRRVIKVLLLMDLFRSRRQKSQRADTVEGAWKQPSDVMPDEPTRKHWDSDVEHSENGACNSRKQPFCFLYVLRKRILPPVEVTP
mmetsp:Transcript_60325/g.143710  ORF Transcript_60325/g.143710 Transcript_60325/m.143710 type:complete len:340 (+) Transcript_60325:139-1158(+)